MELILISTVKVTVSFHNGEDIYERSRGCFQMGFVSVHNISLVWSCW